MRRDFRDPSAIRAALTSLENTREQSAPRVTITFQKVWRFAKILAEHQ